MLAVTTRSEPAGRWVCITTTAELAAQSKLVRMAEGIEVLLCRLGSEIAALQNRCTHLGKPLNEGRLMGGQISCPFHGACFDLRTGAAVSGPAVHPVRVFPVRIDAGQVLVNLEGLPAGSQLEEGHV